MPLMPLHLALCLAMSPSSVIGVLTHHSETRTTLKFVCHLGLKVIFLIVSQYVVYNNNSSNFSSITWCTTRFYPRSLLFFNLQYRNDLTHKNNKNLSKKKKKKNLRAKKRGAVNTRGAVYTTLFTVCIKLNMLVNQSDGK